MTDAVGNDLRCLPELLGLNLELFGLLFEDLFLRRLRDDDSGLDQGVVVFLAAGVDAVVVGLQGVVRLCCDADFLRAFGGLAVDFAVLHVGEKGVCLAALRRGEKGVGRAEGALRHRVTSGVFRTS